MNDSIGAPIRASSHWKQIIPTGIMLPSNEMLKLSAFVEIKPAASAKAFSPCVFARAGLTFEIRIASLKRKELTTFCQAGILPLKLGSNLAKPAYALFALNSV